jgi:hypothetical protein
MTSISSSTSNSKQNESGRAFEYAVFLAMITACKRHRLIINIQRTRAFEQASGAYRTIGPTKRTELKLAAIAGVESVCLLEPKLLDRTGSNNLNIYLSEDAAGKKGDPRDIVVHRQGWELGLSAKHESPWIKSPRVSNLGSFGKSWLQLDCTQEYRHDITNAFALANEYLGQNWEHLPKTPECKVSPLKREIYSLVLLAFKAELLRLEQMHGSIVPSRLMQFLLGAYDYYKLARMGQATQLQPFNMYGGLGQKSISNGPITPVKRLKLPDRFLQIEISDWDKMRIHFDCGWQIELRVHNKDKQIAPSLAFETSVIGQPSSLFTLLMPWGLKSAGVVRL